MYRLQQQQLCGREACINDASRKKEKWSSVPAYLAVTVEMHGADDTIARNVTTVSSTATTHHEGRFNKYAERTFDSTKTPYNTRQLEDYTSARASFQKLWLSLPSEGLSTKWATGPVIRCGAFRDLIQCHEEEDIVALICPLS